MSRVSVFGGKARGARLERMQGCARWADGVFRNTLPEKGPHLKPGAIATTLADYVTGGGRRRPAGPLPVRDPREAWGRRAEGLRVTWLGHSTVLLEFDGLKVLTDPVWGERASPLGFAGPRRFQPMPVPFSALPPLDAILVSHDHYDHLDLPTMLEIARLDVPIFTSLGVGAHLESWGVAPERITELDWWESASPARSELRFTAAPSQHFSGRGVRDRNVTAWSSFVIEGPRHKVFFSGDTGLTREYEEIRARLGPFDLTMLEVGAFHEAWADIHLGPAGALEAHRMLGGGRLLPVHWGTFDLATHAWDDPAEQLLRLVDPRTTQLVMPRAGEVIDPARFDVVEPWWRPAGGEAVDPVGAPG